MLAFWLKNEKYLFLTDHLLKVAKADEVSWTHIFISHVHFDDIGDIELLSG